MVQWIASFWTIVSAVSSLWSSEFIPAIRIVVAYSDPENSSGKYIRIKKESDLCYLDCIFRYKKVCLAFPSRVILGGPLSVYVNVSEYTVILYTEYTLPSTLTTTSSLIKTVFEMLGTK